MDALRINAATIFRNLHERYRALYDDFRDEHFYLRILTRSNGVISYGENITVKLWLPGSLQPRTVKALESLVTSVQDDINDRLPPDSRRLRLELLTGAIQT